MGSRSRQTWNGSVWTKYPVTIWLFNSCEEDPRKSLLFIVNNPKKFCCPRKSTQVHGPANTTALNISL